MASKSKPMDSPGAGGQQEMILELTINGHRKGYADVDLTGTISTSDRKDRVREYASGLFRAFSRDILCTPDWEIVLICQSKMNYRVKQ